MNNENSLLIRRTVVAKKAVTETTCPPGRITVLIDEADDGVLLSYRQAFGGNKTDERFEYQLNGKSIALSDCYRIGFDERLPDDIGVAAYLQTAGYSEAEANEIIQEFDLDKFGYLNCSGLNATATRQVQLACALRRHEKVILIDDPFGPFSGRWREHMAQRLLEYMQTSESVIVVTNLSFSPNSWEGADCISSIDVGKAAENAQRAAEKRSALEEQRKLAEATALAAEALDMAESSDSQKADPPEWMPENMQTAYKGVYDWIFEPLANLSNALRDFSGMAVPASVVGVGVLVGALMYPSMGEYREKLSKIAEGFHQTSTEASQPANQQIQSAESSDSRQAARTVEAEESKPGGSNKDGTITASNGSSSSAALKAAAEMLDEMLEDPSALDQKVAHLSEKDLNFCNLNAKHSCDNAKTPSCDSEVSTLVLSHYELDN